MKLSDVIEFATKHQKFLDFIEERRISPDSAHEVLAKVSNVSDIAIEHRIYIDFGNPGQSTSDIRIIVDYNRQTGDFNFIQIDNPVR